MIRISLAVAFTAMALSAVYPRQEPLPVPVPRGWRRLFGRRARRKAEEEQGEAEAAEFLADVNAVRGEMPWARPDAGSRGDFQASVCEAENVPTMMLQPRPGGAPNGKGRHRRVVTSDGKVTRVDVTGAMSSAQSAPRPGTPASRPRRDRRAPTIVLKVLDEIEGDLGPYLKSLPRYDD